VMNAVMMGLTPSDADARYADILAFAELEDFEHLKLKNYSSGMRARLGFATMVHVDADLLLFDEVLAVGDAGFQERCSTTFRRIRDSGRTGVLVTHSMDALEQHCDRALLLEGGRVLAYGEPRDVAREYISLGDRPLTAPPGTETGNGAGA
jgi:ABC-type polysaccharide/polyol phosphate transport system ATPase subunit